MTAQTSNTRKRAAKLPAPVPGQEVTIPLDLLPAYLQLHGIEPAGCQEKAAGPVLVVKKAEE